MASDPRPSPPPVRTLRTSSLSRATSVSSWSAPCRTALRVSRRSRCSLGSPICRCTSAPRSRPSFGCTAATTPASQWCARRWSFPRRSRSSSTSCTRPRRPAWPASDSPTPSLTRPGSTSARTRSAASTTPLQRFRACTSATRCSSASPSPLLPAAGGCAGSARPTPSSCSSRSSRPATTSSSTLSLVESSC